MMASFDTNLSTMLWGSLLLSQLYLVRLRRQKCHWVEFGGTTIKTHLISCPLHCEKLVFQYKVSEEKILGLDVEWRPSVRTSDGQSGRAAVLQLAFSGCVFVIQLFPMDGIPECIAKILQDPSILKVGVGIVGDVRKLYRDWNAICEGYIELNDLNQGDTSLSRMCSGVLGIRMRKDKNITLSDWQSVCLTNKQVEYAALDAIVSRAIFVTLCRGKVFHLDPTSLIQDKFIEKRIEGRSFCLPTNAKKDQFEVQSRRLDGNDNIKDYEKVDKEKEKRKKRASRQTPLYDNCTLQAPDGQVISMIPLKKMNWYLNRGLATELDTGTGSKTIRLLFEPQGRTMIDDPYYLKVKENICVRCGNDMLLNKFYVIPYEFRQYFPFRFKVRSSHDIVLICVDCREGITPAYEAKKKMFYMDAFGPLWKQYEENNQRHKISHEVVKARKSARALLKAKDMIPMERRVDLESCIREVCELDPDTELPDEILKYVLTMDSKVENPNYESAAEILVGNLLAGSWHVPRPEECESSETCSCFLCYGDVPKPGDIEHIRLKGFVRSWRYHFINLLNIHGQDTGNFLPEGWSIHHKIQDYEDGRASPRSTTI